MGVEPSLIKVGKEKREPSLAKLKIPAEEQKESLAKKKSETKLRSRESEEKTVQNQRPSLAKLKAI